MTFSLLHGAAALLFDTPSLSCILEFRRVIAQIVRRFTKTSLRAARVRRPEHAVTFRNGAGTAAAHRVAKVPAGTDSAGRRAHEFDPAGDIKMLCNSWMKIRSCAPARPAVNVTGQACQCNQA